MIMRRRPVIPQPQKSDSPLTLQVLQQALQMLNQVSNLNRQLLDLVTFAQSAPQSNREVLSEVTSIKIDIDEIENTYKERVNSIKGIAFNSKTQTDLKRLLDRITDKLFRKNTFHQKYHKYLPNNILLNKQILKSLKTLTREIETQTSTNLLQLVQILNYLQYENILLYKHLVGMFISNNIIQSQQQILRQVVKQKQISSSSESQSNQHNQKDEQFDFKSYINTSLIQMSKSKNDHVFEIPKRVRSRFTRQSLKSSTSNRSKKINLVIPKINQQVEVQTQIENQSNIENQINALQQKSVQRIQTGLKSKSSRKGKIKHQRITPPNSNQSSNSVLGMGQTHNNVRFMQIQLKIQSLKNLDQSFTQTTKQIPTFSTKKYILNQPRYPKSLHPPLNQTKQNLNAQSLKKPITKNLNQTKNDDSYYFVLDSKNQSPISKQKFIKPIKTNKGKRIIKNFSSGIVKNEIQKPQDLKTPFVLNNTRSQQLKGLNLKTQNSNNINISTMKQRNTTQLAPLKKRLNIKQCGHKTYPIQILTQFSNQNLCSTKYATPQQSLHHHSNNQTMNRQLQNILMCNSFNIYDPAVFARKRVYRNKCNCKSNNHHQNSKDILKKYLRQQYRDIKQLKQQNCAQFDFNISRSSRKGKMKIPMYYRTGKSLKQRLITRDAVDRQNQSLLDLFTPRGQTLDIKKGKQLKGSLLLNPLHKHPSPRSNNNFSKNKQKVYQIYDTIRRRLI